MTACELKIELLEIYPAVNSSISGYASTMGFLTITGLRQMNSRHLLPIALLSLFPIHLQACTLWAAAGADASGGTLISKNRDWKPDHTQKLKLVHPKTGFTYFGLYAEGNDDPGLKAGINEKGLTVISASSNLPKKALDNQPGKHGVMTQILTTYSSIDALAADADKIFSESRANFFMVSDRHKVLVAEVGLEGKFSIKVVDTGPVTHTNHYLDPQLAAEFNKKIGPSSATRFARINTLLEQAPRPYTPAQFATISRDHNDGPDNSLWRNGKEFTMASWIVETPAEGAPRLRVVIANPNEAENLQELVLDEAFWKK